MTKEFDISVDQALLEDERKGLYLKLSSPIVEVNVALSLDEAKALRQVLTLRANARGLHLGVSANSQVHWARGEGKEIYLLIGHDDETWDIGVTLSAATFQEIVDEVEKSLEG